MKNRSRRSSWVSIWVEIEEVAPLPMSQVALKVVFRKTP